MTPRQRLLAHLKRQPADRVGATIYEFSHVDKGRPLSDPGYAAVAEVQRQLGECFVHTGADFGTGVGDRNVVSEGAADFDKTQQTTVTIDTPRGPLTEVRRREAGNITSWQIKALIENAEDCRRWLSLPTRPATPDIAAIRAAQAAIGEDGLVILGPGDPLGLVCGMFHYDGFVMTLLEDEGLILEMLAITAERLCDGLRRICSQVRDVCVRFWGPEYAGAPLLNPRKYFPKLVVDFLREPVAIVNESGNYSVIHCHGRLADLLDYIADLAPTALEPLEVLPATTADVTIEQVKARLGGRMCLMGGIEATELERMSPDALDARCRTIIEAAKGGGGFVLLPTAASIEYPLPRRVVDNCRVYFESAHKYGGY